MAVDESIRESVSTSADLLVPQKTKNNNIAEQSSGNETTEIMTHYRADWSFWHLKLPKATEPNTSAFCQN